MSVLADVDLSQAIADGRLVCEPLAEHAIQPSSIDVRLGPELLVATPDGYRLHHLIDDGPLRMHQLMFVLGSTLEWIEVAPDLMAVLAGKSSLARRGIQIESAGIVDAGWKGRLTLEIVMLSPIPTTLTCGEMVAQLYVQQMLSAAEHPYGSKGIGRYQGSTGPVESRAFIGRAS